MLFLEACLHKFPRKRMEKAAASPSPRKSPLAIWLVALATLLPWKSSFCKHASKQHDFKERSIIPNILTILLRLTSCQPSWMARLKRPCLVDDCLVSFLTKFVSSVLRTNIWTNHWRAWEALHSIWLHLSAIMTRTQISQILSLARLVGQDWSQS